MSTPKKRTRTIDELMESASEALAQTRYFECERLAAEALERAHAERDFERMARILMPLQEARRHKRQQAIDVGTVTILDDEVPEDEPIDPGVYLVQPPRVGADGRDLRERADKQEVPILVVVREPTTGIGLTPIVMIGPTTVRTRVKGPGDPEAPDLAWVVRASEQLGDEAIAEVDEDLPAATRVDNLYDRLRTCVEHEKLHQRLADACRAAIKEAADGKGKGSRRRAG